MAEAEEKIMVEVSAHVAEAFLDSQPPDKLPPMWAVVSLYGSVVEAKRKHNHEKEQELERLAEEQPDPWHGVTPIPPELEVFSDQPWRRRADWQWGPLPRCLEGQHHWAETECGYLCRLCGATDYTD
jgi:hypothetical protein